MTLGKDAMPTTGPGKRTATHARLAAAGSWLLLLTVGLSLHFGGTLRGYERATSSLWHRLAGQRAEPQHVAIVGIDERALQARPDEPLSFWTPHIARALTVLQRVNAKVVAIDLLFSVSAEAWLAKAGLAAPERARTFDRPFRQALGEGRVLLTAFATDETATELLLPNADYWLALPQLLEQVALSNLEYDDDGVLRGFRLLSDRAEAPRVFLGPLLAARAGGQPPGEANWRIGGRLRPAALTRPVPFCGPPGTVPVLSIERLLADGAERDPAVQGLAGKVVILAATYHAAQDAHLTPYAPDLMNGAEIHAQIAEALLSGRGVGGLPPWQYAILIAVMAAFAVSLVRQQSGTARGAALALLGVIALGGASYLAFLGDVTVAAGSLQATLLCGYVLGLAMSLRGSERRRAALKAMFGRYVSDEVVEHLLQTDDDPDVAGQTREVTVLFSDIRSFTTLSERMSPHMVVEMLNAWFSEVSEPVLEAGGTIDKFIGDAIMVVFGAPVAHPDHARRALRAAAAMDRKAKAFQGWMKTRFPDLDLPPFAIGVGLHTGEALSGNIGSPRRMEFTTIGDTVNAASRIEGLTKGFDTAVVISREVADAAGPGLRLGEARQVHVKGKDEPLEVMAFLGFASAEDVQ